MNTLPSRTTGFIFRLVVYVASVLSLVTASHVYANLVTIKGASTPAVLVASSNNMLNLRWQISTDAGHVAGVASSGQASFFNSSVPGPSLLDTGGAVSDTGSGPFLLTETLSVSGAQVQGWLDAGIQRVVIRRTFTGGNTLFGYISVPLSQSRIAASRASASELAVQRLRIDLDQSGSASKVIAIHEALQPTLTVSYTGSGMFEGRWQIAEPGSTEGKPLYRTLSIVRQPLVKSQQSELKGPVLPSHRVGKYILRFCVAPTGQDVLAGGTADCPIPDQTVQAVYQVVGGSESLADMALKSPNQESVDNGTPFAWQPVSGAVMYRLDVFEKQGDQQWFITGMLLPSANHQTVLSELMQLKLHTGGLYAWQVSAINEQGKVIAQSKQGIFSYQP